MATPLPVDQFQMSSVRRIGIAISCSLRPLPPEDNPVRPSPRVLGQLLRKAERNWGELNTYCLLHIYGIQQHRALQ